LRAIFRLLNMPMDDIPAFTGWIELTPIDIVAHSTEEVQQVALDAMTNMKNYFRDFVAERKNHVQDGLIDRVIEAGESGAISEEELLSNLVSLTMAGHDTTISLLSNGLYLLLQYPEQMTLLREDRSLLKSAIEEMLRYEPGSNVLNRIALRDFTLKDGRTIAKGTMCTGLTNSTNRDPAAFEDPDTFDIRRHPNPHQTFGRGFHQCLGAELSRLEARVAFTHLLDRFARIELRPGAHWNLERLIIRRLDTLPVVLGN
ncbi:MAG: cytochrome P450, partial [Verrucomicrobiota bacterium]